MSRPLTGDEEAEVRAVLTDRLRYAFDYDFVYVDEITRAANGKFFEFQSEVSTLPTRADN